MRAWALAWVVRLWVATLRLRRIGDPPEGAVVVAFWHGDQLALLGALPRRPWRTATSLSRDGALQTGVMRCLGIEAARGSSSRSGARAALGLLRALSRGEGVLVACDGPRGPRRVAKAGAAYLARRAAAPLVPVGFAARRTVVLRRSWDHFRLPWPFTRVVVVVGPAVGPDAPLEAALSACETTAREALAG